VIHNSNTRLLFRAHRNPRVLLSRKFNRRFTLKVVDWPSGPREETTTGWDALDFDRLRWPLVLRNWRPGDSYRPHRRRRVRKLKRMLLESRVPRCDRTSWPVLTSAGALVWALGCPVADEFAVGSGTRAGVVYRRGGVLKSELKVVYPASRLASRVAELGPCHLALISRGVRWTPSLSLRVLLFSRRTCSGAFPGPWFAILFARTFVT